MEREASRMKNMFWIIFILFAAALVIPIGKGWLDGRFSSVQTMQQYIASFGVLSPVLLTAMQALQVIIPVLPGFFGCIVGTALFGPVGSFVCNYVGISAGSIIAFYLAKRFGMAFVRQVIPQHEYDKCVKWVSEKKCYTLLLFAAILLPLAPDDFLCYFSGLLGMSDKTFIWIILVAKPWCILAYCAAFGVMFR